MTTDDPPQFLPYQDASLPVHDRVEDLLARMDDADKAGLLFHTIVGVQDHTEPNEMFGLPSVASLIHDRRMNHFNLLGSAPSGRDDLPATTEHPRDRSRHKARWPGLPRPVRIAPTPGGPSHTIPGRNRFVRH